MGSGTSCIPPRSTHGAGSLGRALERGQGREASSRRGVESTLPWENAKLLDNLLCQEMGWEEKPWQWDVRRGSQSKDPSPRFWHLPCSASSAPMASAWWGDRASSTGLGPPCEPETGSAGGDPPSSPLPSAPHRAARRGAGWVGSHETWGAHSQNKRLLERGVPAHPTLVLLVFGVPGDAPSPVQRDKGVLSCSVLGQAGARRAQRFTPVAGRGNSVLLGTKPRKKSLPRV